MNKQYEENEYNELLPRIIEHMKETGEWGYYFPPEYSLFGYNKTTAQMWFPLDRDEIEKRGWNWDDYEQPLPDVSFKISAKDLPDNIDEVGDDILDTAIECEASGKFFRIVPLELKFYRKQRLPIPRKSPEERHLERFGRRNPRKFWKRQCEKCGKEILTTYSQDSGYKVCCEGCYMKRIL